MPSIKKRIGYLPSINAQEKITQIAKKENLSQSKVVGLLVEEALEARDGFDNQYSNNSIRKNLHVKANNVYNSSLNFNDIDELISDKGISYNTKNHRHNSNDDLSQYRGKHDEELFEQFKQFVQFQKMRKDQ
ncbi:hypothetical protein [Prochlorococcus marinus]|uniref:hypothetical protein n=1 Tax=Prochlorococcus marinus TaxID=1219 RepID=UPI0022B5AFC3|nr:hypothetical protein [Prochlorococcus marinus]